jgi:outer membrane protein
MNNKYSIMLKIVTFFICLVFLSTILFSQVTWNLVKCTNYAVENNIELSITNNEVVTQQINLTESKANLLPNLNAGSGVGMNFGRNIDGNTNEVTFDQTLGNNYWVESSVNLFQGLVQYNTISFNRFMLVAKEQQAEWQKNQLIFQVMTAYYTVLYSNGIADVARNQVELSELQYKHMSKLVDVGKESPVMLQDLRSQWANEKLSFIQAQNRANSSLLELKQLLRINANYFFELDTLNINSLVINPLPNIDSVFRIAAEQLPEIKNQEYLVLASEKELDLAKGTISPRLYLQAGYYTDYFDANRTDQETQPYSTQLENNQSQRVNLGVIIPIFNGTSTYSRIKRKQIEVIDRKLQLEKRLDDLYAEIWKAVNDLQSAQSEYESSVELLGFSSLSLQNATKKMEKGLASTTDYEAAKQRFVSAEAELLKAKLLYMMRNQMLEFYITANWSHL